VGNAVHRLVEQQAARRPDVVAVADGGRDGGGTLTYRELNGRANTRARRLKESGLARGALAYVRLPRSADLAVVLLAVLKAGAAYVWVEPGSHDDIDTPSAFCVADRPARANGDAATEDRYTAIDISQALAECAGHPSANLPVLTRGSDVACVLPDAQGRPHVLVPHETIAALPQPSSPHASEPHVTAAGALDLWVGLMSGATLTLGVDNSSTAAA
jgi:non-ribosomal peptide synthetase component E (peptide arylation enzyme)